MINIDNLFSENPVKEWIFIRVWKVLNIDFIENNQDKQLNIWKNYYLLMLSGLIYVRNDRF
mgnify:CR=1 FL=1